jgi:excinuclease ABC subunit C
MISQFFQKKLKRLPDSPGVYFFLKARKGILYIGRATSLRSRVRSYFVGNLAEKRSTWIAKMLGEVRGVDYQKTDSVLEAILLEAELIRKFRPPYNTDLKDDKSFNCVVITKEDFPVVRTERSKNIDFSSLRIKDKGLRILALYGPFPAGLQLHTALKIVRRIFPYRDSKCRPISLEVQSQRGLEVEPQRPKPCFNRQIGLCPGVCTGEISKQEYGKTIRHIRLFFEGKKARLLKLLEREMKTAAQRQEFERAGEYKRQLFALRHIQDVALLRTTNNQLPTTNFRIEAYDLSHFGGREIVGAMTVVVDNRSTPNEYRLFKLRGLRGQHEAAGLQEILRRRFAHPEWPLPQLIVVDGNEVQKQVAEVELTKLGYTIPVLAVVKDEKHRPRDIIGFEELGMKDKGLKMSILLANSEAHRFALKFQRRKRDIIY